MKCFFETSVFSQGNHDVNGGQELNVVPASFTLENNRNNFNYFNFSKSPTSVRIFMRLYYCRQVAELAIIIPYQTSACEIIFFVN